MFAEIPLATTFNVFIFNFTTERSSMIEALSLQLNKRILRDISAAY